MEKVKVLFLIHDLGGGGAENVLVNLVNHMDAEKFDITVETIFGGGINEKRLSKDIHYISKFSHTIPGNCAIMRLFSPSQLHNFFIKEKYDVEIAYTECAPTRIISGCEDRFTKRFAWIHCTSHSTKTLSASFKNTEEVERCYQRFEKIFCVSKTVLDSFLNCYPNIKNVDVLHNTIESELILQKKDEVVEDDIFKENEIKICGVGKLTKLKGFDRLARIHKRLRDKGYPIHTYILGTGEEKENLEQYAKENDISDSFTLLGYQTNPYKYMSHCDIFVCSSFSEGFSTATMEALIIGNAICAVEVSGMKEILGENNEYGIITENNEEALFLGLEQLIQDYDLLNHYKKQAKIRSKEFNSENTVKAVEESLRG